MAKAGVTYTLTREGNAKYGETYNGIHYDEKYRPRTKHLKPGPNGRVPGGQGVWDRDFPLDPYVVPGDPKSGLLPLIQAGEPGTPGEPAPGVQAYCFRLCLTKAADRLPIAPPPELRPAAVRDRRRGSSPPARRSATTWTCAGSRKHDPLAERQVGFQHGDVRRQPARRQLGLARGDAMPSARRSPRSTRTTTAACCTSWRPTTACRPKVARRDASGSACRATSSPTTAAGRTSSTSARRGAW